jgi:hypothetical protein
VSEDGEERAANSPETPTGNQWQPEVTADLKLDAALTVAEAIRDNRLRRIAQGVMDARLIGTPRGDPPAH